MIVAKVDDRSVQQGLREVAKAGHDLADVFRRMRQPMRRDQAEHARAEAGPDGPWPARKSRSRERKLYAKVRRRRGGASTAQVFRFNGLLGVLPDLIQVKAVGATVIARSPIKWARAHADGATVGRGADLPERPFLWVSEDLAALASKMIGDHLSRAWKGK